MKLIRSIAKTICLTFFTISAYANEVLLTTNQSTKVAYKIAHKNRGGEVSFDALQTVTLNRNQVIPIKLNGYDLTGLVIVSVNGHELPPTANQFDQAKQCSMTTDKTKATGALEFTLEPKSIRCRTYGGIFG